MKSMAGHLTAQEALGSNIHPNGEIAEWVTTFVCPHPNCRAVSAHRWGQVTTAFQPTGHIRQLKGFAMYAAACDACKQEVIFLDGKLMVPAVSEAPAAAADMPEAIKPDFEEARQIVRMSPRGAAALLRLAVQKLLPLIGAPVDDINKMIGFLVDKGTISPAIQKALDSVRIIGNEAVHPGEMDLRDDVATATSLFNLINFIIEKAITEPKEIAQLYSGLPAAKLNGIEKRDAPKP